MTERTNVGSDGLSDQDRADMRRDLEDWVASESGLPNSATACAECGLTMGQSRALAAMRAEDTPEIMGYVSTAGRLHLRSGVHRSFMYSQPNATATIPVQRADLGTQLLLAREMLARTHLNTALAVLGPNVPECSGCAYEWKIALEEVQKAHVLLPQVEQSTEALHASFRRAMNAVYTAYSKPGSSFESVEDRVQFLMTQIMIAFSEMQMICRAFPEEK